MADLFLISTEAERAEELVRCVSAVSSKESAPALSAAAAAGGAPGGSYEPLLTLALDHAAALLRGATADEVEGAFTLVLSFFAPLPAETQRALAERIVAAATAAADAKAAGLRLRVLVNVYNTVSAKALKLDVFGRIVGFAAETRQIDALAPYLASAATWQTRWGITPAEAGALFLLVARALERTGHAEAAQTFLIRHLSTFEGVKPAAARAGARPAAKQAAINFVRAPAVSQRSNLASMAAIADMAGDAELGRLHALVDIFAHKSLDAFLAFADANGAYLAELGVDIKSATETMRLLTLCTLAAGADTLSYATVAAALQVPVTELESWVVRAISAGLIDARMDQQARSLTVLRSLQRDVNVTQWTELQRKLHAWRDAVGTSTATLAAAR